MLLQYGLSRDLVHLNLHKQFSFYRVKNEQYPTNQRYNLSSLKVLLRSNYWYSFFYIFVYNMTFLYILPNFNPLRKLEVILFLLLFPRIYGRHYLTLFQGLVANLRKWRHMCKNTSRVEIIITISIKNCTKNMSKIFVALYSIFYTYCYYNFNPWGIFAHMTSFSLIRNQALEQGQVMAAVNSRK